MHCSVYSETFCNLSLQFMSIQCPKCFILKKRCLLSRKHFLFLLTQYIMYIIQPLISASTPSEMDS